MSDISRNDEWNSDRPRESEERKYDGPAGMDPDGVIDSNWEEVNENIIVILVMILKHHFSRFVRISMT